MIPLPPKLPVVVGSGFLASGFRRAFESINALRECIERIQLKQGIGYKASQTSGGTVLTVDIPKVEESTTTEGGPARWS